MGTPDDASAVVDSRGRVFGVNALRVVDTSAWPFLIPGQPQATTCGCFSLFAALFVLTFRSLETWLLRSMRTTFCITLTTALPVPLGHRCSEDCPDRSPKCHHPFNPSPTLFFPITPHLAPHKHPPPTPQPSYEDSTTSTCPPVSQTLRKPNSAAKPPPCCQCHTR